MKKQEARDPRAPRPRHPLPPVRQPHFLHSRSQRLPVRPSCPKAIPPNRDCPARYLPNEFAPRHIPRPDSASLPIRYYPSQSSTYVSNQCTSILPSDHVPPVHLSNPRAPVPVLLQSEQQAFWAKDSPLGFDDALNQSSMTVDEEQPKLGQGGDGVPEQVCQSLAMSTEDIEKSKTEKKQGPLFGGLLLTSPKFQNSQPIKPTSLAPENMNTGDFENQFSNRTLGHNQSGGEFGSECQLGGISVAGCEPVQGLPTSSLLTGQPFPSPEEPNPFPFEDENDKFDTEITAYFLGDQSDTPPASPTDPEEEVLSPSEIDPLLQYRYAIPRNITQDHEQLQKLVSNPEKIVHPQKGIPAGKDLVLQGPDKIAHPQKEIEAGEDLVLQGSQPSDQKPGCSSAIVPSPFPAQTQEERRACAEKIEILKTYIPYLKISLESKQDPTKSRKTQKLLDVLQHKDPLSFNLPLHVLTTCENALKAMESTKTNL